jgi:hypothetical protein
MPVRNSKRVVIRTGEYQITSFVPAYRVHATSMDVKSFQKTETLDHTQIICAGRESQV